MPGGMAVSGSQSYDYQAKVTPFVVVASLVAASGGLMFGYDIGISGGVTSMDEFLEKFFPSVYRAEKHADNSNMYCKFDSQLLTAFTSSLYIAGLIATFFASTTTQVFGRRITLLMAGIAFMAGSAFNGAARNVAMLIIGRIILGIGIGFANQVVPLYLSEMAPPKLRGALSLMFQMATTIGILIANLINYGTNRIKGGYGWRISLALAGVPSIVIFLGALWLPDTPNSLVERGFIDEARKMLQKIRGTEFVEEELQDIMQASEAAARVEHPWREITTRRRYRPHLAMAVLIPGFQQLTGINVIMFYAPVLFKMIGFGADASLMSAIVTGVINMVATLVSIATVDKFGRRILFLEGGVQMLISQVAIAVVLAKTFGTSGVGSLTSGMSNLVLVLICFYVAAFAWSWGPLAWLVPSEIFPLEIRSAGQSIVVSVNLFWTFVVAQLFLMVLCHAKFGIFLIFAVFVLIMTTFVFFFLPETKGVPLEEMDKVWKKHWFWKSYIDDVNVSQNNNSVTRMA